MANAFPPTCLTVRLRRILRHHPPPRLPRFAFAGACYLHIKGILPAPTPCPFPLLPVPIPGELLPHSTPIPRHSTFPTWPSNLLNRHGAYRKHLTSAATVVYTVLEGVAFDRWTFAFSTGSADDRPCHDHLQVAFLRGLAAVPWHELLAEPHTAHSVRSILRFVYWRLKGCTNVCRPYRARAMPPTLPLRLPGTSSGLPFAAGRAVGAGTVCVMQQFVWRRQARMDTGRRMRRRNGPVVDIGVY